EKPASRIPAPEKRLSWISSERQAVASATRGGGHEPARADPALDPHPDALVGGLQGAPGRRGRPDRRPARTPAPLPRGCLPLPPGDPPGRGRVRGTGPGLRGPFPARRLPGRGPAARPLSRLPENGAAVSRHRPLAATAPAPRERSAAVARPQQPVARR